MIEHLHFPYTATMTRLNVACYANFALAPESPGGLAVAALPGGTLRLTWSSVMTAPDLAGYRAALRGTEPDSIYYFDVRDAGLDPGATQTHVIDGLAPGVPVQLSVSAYDTGGNESIFGPGVLATPLRQ